MSDTAGFYLLDDWLDGCVRERCWIPVQTIDSAQYAVERAAGGRVAAALAFLRRWSAGAIDHFHEDDLVLADASRRAWLRPVGSLNERGQREQPTDEPCDECGGSGADPGQPDDVCAWCHGTGHHHMTFDEGCPWKDCGPDADGAVAFYEFEAVEMKDGDA